MRSVVLGQHFIHVPVLEATETRSIRIRYPQKIRGKWVHYFFQPTKNEHAPWATVKVGISLFFQRYLPQKPTGSS